MSGLVVSLRCLRPLWRIRRWAHRAGNISVGLGMHGTGTGFGTGTGQDALRSMHVPGIWRRCTDGTGLLLRMCRSLRNPWS